MKIQIMIKIITKKCYKQVYQDVLQIWKTWYNVAFI